MYMYIYISPFKKGCLQTDRYVDWVIDIKYVKKRMLMPSLLVSYQDLHRSFGGLVVRATASYL